MRDIFNLNFEWFFHDGEILDTNFNSVHQSNFSSPRFMKSANCGIAKVGYPSESWDKVNIPHDLRHYKAVYDKTIPSPEGFLATGIAWYRKEFFLDEKDEGRAVILDFDGVYRDCEVYVNANFVGRHLSGYTSFNFDITDFVEFGENNAISVRVDATQFEGWWYEAGGIYRDVKLILSDKLKVKQDGICVSYEILDEDARINVAVELENNCEKTGNAKINFKVLDNEKNQIAFETCDFEIERYKEINLSQDIFLNDVNRWDIDNPYKYSVQVEVVFEKKIVDEVTQSFGIREILYTADRGIILNSRQVKIQGVCVHDDFAGVGGAMSRSVIRHKIYLLKQMGVNGYRCSHNPPSPYVLEACDDYGMLVMDETRLMNTSTEYIKQMTDLMKRDRNHPCVFIWSIGNEEMGIHGTKLGVRIGNHLLRLAHELDSSRPCVYSNNCNWKEITDFHEENGLHMDIFGFNYYCIRHFDSYDYIHEKYPDRLIIGTENGSALSTRGQYLMREEEKDMSYFSTSGHDIMIYENEARKFNVSEYAESYTIWGSTAMETLKAADKDYVAGYFIWTGFDYRGELIPFDWPATVSRFGIMDLCGFMKSNAHQYKVKWATKPSIYMFPHWTFPEDIGEVEVDIVANTDEVELFVNGLSQGRRKNPLRELVKYYVPYEKGEIYAIAYNDEEEVARIEYKTASEPVKINLEIMGENEYEADGEDNIFIKVEVLDKDGVHCPNANNLIEFEVEGEGTFLGCGNGDPLSMENDMHPSRKLFNGLALAVLKTGFETGKVKFKAKSLGIEEAVLEIDVNKISTKNPILLAKNIEVQKVIKEKDAADGGF